MIIRLRHTDLSRTALASGRQADTIQDRDAGQQMSAGLAPPLPRISLSSAGRSFISQDVDTCGRPPPTYNRKKRNIQNADQLTEMEDKEQQSTIICAQIHQNY